MQVSKMEEIKQHYFYLWCHRYVDDATEQVVTRTCLGITSNPTSRVQGYEGHVGHAVKFTALWAGPERLIRDLEDKIKREFYDYLFVGTGGFRYEWIDENIDHQVVHRWVEWEVENSYIGINKVKELT
jgi:hypothetical protein